MSRTRTRLPLLLTVLATVAVVLGSIAPAASAHGRHHHPLGDRSLATVLAADGDTFDHNWRDYDITYQAVLAVLTAKPDSAVSVLTDGTVPLTAFVPTDKAFRKLAHQLTGKRYWSESKVFADLAGTLGVDTIESVLLYHVVPGATIDYRTAKHSDGAVLATALTDASLTVDVKRCWHHKVVTLVDNDPDARNARVVAPNINKGNVQIAHGIDRVLRPLDL